MNCRQNLNSGGNLNEYDNFPFNSTHNRSRVTAILKMEKSGEWVQITGLISLILNITA